MDTEFLSFTYMVSVSPHICRSITGTIFPSISPPLIHSGAVEFRLAETHVDAVMKATEPLRESVAAAGVWLTVF